MDATRILLAVFLASITAAGAEAPPPPAPPARVFPEWSAITDTEALRKVVSGARGTPEVEWLGKGSARLPVSFRGEPVERASWDIRIKTDLRATRGIQFDFYCRDLTPFSSFSLYFHSGGGWYHATFSPGRAGAWQRVVIDKADTRIEGQPAGWGEVDMLRISGWRGRDADTECAIANPGPSGDKPMVLVVRADSNMDQAGGEAESLQRYAATVSSTLDRLGVDSAQVADSDLAAELLREVKLVVLPYNPRVPAETAAILRGFVEGGGKLLACYTLGSGVAELLGLRSTGSEVPEGGPFAGFARVGEGVMGQPGFAPQGSWRSHLVAPVKDGGGRVIAVWRDGKGRDTGIPAITLTPTGGFIGHVWFSPAGDESVALMRALVGELVPEVWRQAAESAFKRIGTITGAAGFDELRAELSAAAPEAACLAIAEAAKARDEARRTMEAGGFSQSVAASARADAAALRAWCLCRKPRTPEHRAVWCHSAFGLDGKDWEESIRLLKESGFNAILPNMLWGGLAYYPSAVLPEYDGLARRGDQLGQCLAACRKFGVKCHVWKVNWNTGGKAPPEFLDRIRAEGRGQVSYGGERQNEWLCPSHPANRDLEVASMLEIVERYQVDGIHFDYIRYPGGDNCFCDGCRGRFEKVLGRAVANWPADTRQDAGVREKWLDFRRSNITIVVRTVAEKARKIRPGVQVSAAVFRNWPSDRDGVGQDWKQWCDEGWLDFVCPMDYIESNDLFRNVVETQKEYAGKVPLYPGIGLSCWKDPRDAVKLAQQIGIVRELGVPGFTVFNFDANAEAVLPYLRLGVTKE